MFNFSLNAFILCEYEKGNFYAKGLARTLVLTF